MECCFCNNKLSSKSNLIAHQKNSKYCLAIQQNKTNEIINILSLSDKILKLIEEKKIDADKIAFMKDNELLPEKYEDIFKKKEIQNSISKNEGSTAFECKKCGERNSEITQRQTRSGDEPPSTFIQCLKCGYKYKFG